MHYFGAKKWQPCFLAFLFVTSWYNTNNTNKTDVRTYVHTYVHTYIHTYMCEELPFNVDKHLGAETGIHNSTLSRQMPIQRRYLNLHIFVVLHKRSAILFSGYAKSEACFGVIGAWNRVRTLTLPLMVGPKHGQGLNMYTL